MINTLKIAAVSLSMAIFTTQAQSSDLNQPSILVDLSQGHMVQHMTDQEKMDTRGEAKAGGKQRKTVMLRLDQGSIVPLRIFTVQAVVQVIGELK